MNIIHWGKYYAPDKGGIESVNVSLAVGAHRRGERVTVVCFGKVREAERATIEGVNVIRLPIDVLKASQPLGWQYVWHAVREARSADIVHVHAPNMLAALISPLVPRRTRLVVHWHSDVVGKGWLARLMRPVERLQLRRADAVICTSQAYAQASETLMAWRDKVSVIPIGVADPRGQTRQAGVLPGVLADFIGERRLVLSVGRLVPYKGFEVLVDAARTMSDQGVIVIVGSGPLRESLQARIDAAGVSHKVLLAGRQEDDALKTLFERARLFCLPSVERSEAFGVVLVEAMAQGLPVVTTEIEGSGVPWVNQHEESGLNVPVGDAVALARACDRIVLNDELHGRLAHGARQRFEQEFTEDLSVERTLALYDRLLATV